MFSIEGIVVIVFGILALGYLFRNKPHVRFKLLWFHFYAGEAEPEETRAAKGQKRKKRRR